MAGNNHYTIISYYDTTGILRQEENTISGPHLNRRIISKYNASGQEISLRVYDKDSLLIKQDNFYGDRNELVSEDRIEYASENDTFHFKYHYIAIDSSQAIEYLRTNNRDTVAKLIEIFKEDSIIEISQTFPVEDANSKSITVRVLNEKGDPVQLKRQIIEWDNKRVDTTTIVDSRFTYYFNGKLKEAISFNKGEETKRQTYFYKHGALQRKRVTNKAGQYTLVYQNTFR
jgi:antitoxin component YwqK of YwqJK toxin-antitoxin module